MNYRKLGKTGLMVSEVGCGGIPIQRVDFYQAGKILNFALDSGINFFDTAVVYSDSEEKFGKTISHRKNEYSIASKCYSRKFDSAYSDILRSLEKLNIDTIDLYQLHNISSEKELDTVLNRNDGAILALEKAKKQGIIDHIGISSHKTHILQKAIELYDFETIQVPFNIIEKESEILFDTCNQKNIGIIIMKPLAGGHLKPASVSLKYILQYPVSVVIPGMQSIDEVKENISLEKSLTEEELRRLKSLAKELGKNFCRKCEYCIPVCPQDINITMIFLLRMYYKNYNLKNWAKERYATLNRTSQDCIECGACEQKCPYHLPIRELIKEAHTLLS